LVLNNRIGKQLGPESTRENIANNLEFGNRNSWTKLFGTTNNLEFGTSWTKLFGTTILLMFGGPLGYQLLILSCATLMK